MTVGGKILITSKRTFLADDSTADLLPLRKPIKGCYCVYNNNKNSKNKLRSQPSWTTASDTDFWPCTYCKSNFDIKLTDLSTENQLPGAPTFSSDTFRKISKINYTPTSEFLGNVKRQTSRQNSQVSVLTVESQSSIQELSKKSSMADSQLIESRKLGSELKLAKSYESIVSEKNITPEIQTIFTSTASYKNSSSSLTDNKLKKSISLSSDLNSREKEKFVKNLPRIVVQNNCRCKNCLTKDVKARNLTSRKQVCAKCGGKRLSLLSSDKIDSETDKETRELGDFRDKNYFDTHGSSRTLLTTPLTPPEMLRQHQLNDRLFPELVDEDNNLVVSIPLLSDDQLKKIIHYFPRDIVTQYCKNNADTDKKKKNIQRKCPLTGHIINLYKFNHIKKPQPYIISNNNININSLALNFQKKIT
ncbi:GSCOCG00002286001-RA-CDS [Cotesia congregata]|nr:GSCOCG00002286001-RA-CDS [Cotesia congregata]